MAADWEWQRAVRPQILAMAGYVPGEQRQDPQLIKLNTNESPYPPSPRVIEAIQATLTGDRLRKYPEPLGDRFRKAAAEVLRVSPEQILIGNGSDDILTILTRTFVPEGGTIAALTPSYLLYRSLAEIQGAKFIEVPWAEDWQLPEPQPFQPAQLVFLPNPNSPSGTILRPDQLRQFRQALPGVFVLDEAYVDFAEFHGLELVAEEPPTIVTRTFSKFYALAGIRFGFAVGPAKWIEQCLKVKDSYNCDVLSLAAATAAIQDRAYYQDLRAKIVASRGRLAAGLAELGFEVTRSQANFIWCRHPQHTSQRLYEGLREANILVRWMRYPTAEGLRITVGTPDEVRAVLNRLRQLV